MPKSTLVKTLLEFFLLVNFFLAAGISGFACFSNLFEMMLRNRAPQSLLLRWPDCSWFQPSSRDAASLLNLSQQFFFSSISFSDLPVPGDPFVFGTPTKCPVTERPVTKPPVTGRMSRLPNVQFTKLPDYQRPDYQRLDYHFIS
jgi:hypothetical protein